MDIADKAKEWEEKFTLDAITEAARGVRHLPGPKVCRKCEGDNDRWAAGLAVCSGCFEENEDG